MKKSIYSTLTIVTLLVLTTIFSGFSADITNSKSNDLPESEINATSTIEITELVSSFLQKQSNPVKIPFTSKLSSNLVFIPSSFDFKKRSETTVTYYGFQLKNLGGTSTSGQIMLYADVPFSCNSGCSFNLAPSQSQYVSIKFAPCEIPFMEEIPFDGTLFANNAQATVEGIGIDEVSGEPECEY